MSKTPKDLNNDGTVNVLDKQIAYNEGLELYNYLNPEGQALGAEQHVANWTIGNMESANKVLTEKELGRIDQINLAGQGTDIVAQPSLDNIAQANLTNIAGRVDWTAVPSGFQPLPVTTQGKKKLYQLSQFHGGLNNNIDERDISDNECIEAENISFSTIGQITTLGSLGNQDTGLTAIGGNSGSFYDLDEGTPKFPAVGSGYYIYKTSHSLASTPVAGSTDVIVSTDNGNTYISDGTTTHSIDFTGGNTAGEMCPVYHSIGSSLYIMDADDSSPRVRQKVLTHVYRSNFNGTQYVNVWDSGDAILLSPEIDDADNDVFFDWSDGSSINFTAASTNGAARVHIGSDSNIAGDWNGNYYFYISYLYDNEDIDLATETGMVALVDGSGSPTIPTFSNESLYFNFSLCQRHSSNIINADDHLGNEARVSGARVYWRHVDAPERYLLADISLKSGIRISGDTIFHNWTEDSDKFHVGSDIDTKSLVVKSPPVGFTFKSLNGYYNSEVYTMEESTDTYISSAVSKPTPYYIRYDASTVAGNGIVYIGNLIIGDPQESNSAFRTVSDGVLFSWPDKPTIFPLGNFISTPTSKGSSIRSLESYKNKLLCFTDTDLSIFNITNTAEPVFESTYQNCGVMNPCQSFVTEYGVTFVNKFGCYIYNGETLVSLTYGKFDKSTWTAYFIYTTSGLGTRGEDELKNVFSYAGSDGWQRAPSIGYCPRSKTIIIMKGISMQSSLASEVLAYDMHTQSWSEADGMTTLDNNLHVSNFMISHNGYLSYIGIPYENPFNFNKGTFKTTMAISDLDVSSGTATVTTSGTISNNHGFSTGTLVNIDASNNTYDVNGVVITASGPSAFTYTTTESDVSNLTGTVTRISQDITYVTKEIDFGAPTQMKKIFKVFITYANTGAVVPTVTYGINGTKGGTSFDSGSFATSGSGRPVTITFVKSNLTCRSLTIKIAGPATDGFEINDISILYRLRPIK